MNHHFLYPANNIFDFLPFGEEMAAQHSQTADFETRYKFNDYGGKKIKYLFVERIQRSCELDQETGLYYYGARYYNPQTSIWLSVDPLVEKYPGINPYVYTMANPINLVDPDGKGPTTWYVTKTGKTVYVNDGLKNKVVIISDRDYQEARFFANEINGRLVSDEIAEAYISFFDKHNHYSKFSLGNLYDLVFNRPHLLKENNVVGGAGFLEYVETGGIKMALVEGKEALKLVKIQRHHIIPKQIWNRYKSVLKPFMKFNSGFNLKKLPTPFHGNHPQYNRYVGAQIKELINTNNLNEHSLRQLQKKLSNLLNKAYESKQTINEFFRKYNQP